MNVCHKNKKEPCDRAEAATGPLLILLWSYKEDIRRMPGSGRVGRRPTRSAFSVSPRGPGSEPSPEPSVTLPGKLP